MRSRVRRSAILAFFTVSFLTMGLVASPVAADSTHPVVGALLETLEEMNHGPERFNDEWAKQLHRLVMIGPDAVPDLVRELDRTTDDMMLRCLGFVLRAIDDRRAIPALIRAIPRTLRPPGSDMGLQIKGEDAALLRFVQEHDLKGAKRANRYGFGRPVREIFGALRSLSGQDFGEGEVFSIFLNHNDLPRQQDAKAILFQSVAERWSTWWQDSGAQFVDDPAYLEVGLKPLGEFDVVRRVTSDERLKTDSGVGNWILQSVRSKPDGRVFYDLDTGRAKSLPKRWRDQPLTDGTLQDIRLWAAKEGFDLMGDEIEGPNGQAVYVLRPIVLDTWLLPKSRWKESIEDTSIDELRAEGVDNDEDLLLSFDTASGKRNPLATATFFFTTRHGTPGILYVGIEVQDDSLKPGGIAMGDNELNPVAFRKGRRFASKRLVRAE